MPRPPLPIGTYGAINVQKLAADAGYRAYARFRDHDGVTRKVARAGRTAGAAKNSLREHLLDRSQQGPSSGLNGDTRFQAAAEEWIIAIDQLAARGQRSPNTAQLYRQTLTAHVLPAVGALRLRELTVPRLDKFVQDVWAHRGAATAELARTVVSGVVGLAVPQGALCSSPVRHLARISSRPTSQPRALTPAERA